MEWWLIRHGATAWNAERRYQGQSDTELLPGDASGLAPLRETLAGAGFSAVYCSDLSRCRHTLRLLRPDLAPHAVYDSRLREMHFGAWEGQTYDMLKDLEVYRRWLDNPKACTPPEGEPWEQFEGRVRSMYGELASASAKLERQGESRPLLIVTHGGVISMLYTLLVPGSDFWNPQAKIGPGEILKVRTNF